MRITVELRSSTKDNAAIPAEGILCRRAVEPRRQYVLYFGGGVHGPAAFGNNGFALTASSA